MSDISGLSIMKKIEIDRNHIDNFVLETTEGTKRVKEKFHRQAVENRNAYTQKQITIFQNYLDIIKNTLSQRYKELLPIDKSIEYADGLDQINDLLFLVHLNSNISSSFKLKLDFIVSSIQSDTSLEELNAILKKFIDKFHEFGFSLSIDDFKYTMFTEEYMRSFFLNSDFSLMKDTFEKIYFMCPDIKLHLKMNLQSILASYEEKLKKYTISLKNQKLQQYSINNSNVLDKYVSVRYEVGNKIATDEYYNMEVFLNAKRKISDYVDGAAARKKTYDMFAYNEDYDSLSEDDKNSFNSAIMGFYLTLNELKKYFRYEFILKDLLERYKNKDAAKNQYLSKKKEIDKEEKTRIGIYKNYLKASGVGFLAKKNEEKMKDSMLKMNAQINKLNALYTEFRDLEITNNLSQMSESASIYDLFMASLNSFSFLENMFSNNEDFVDSDLEKVVEDYLRFLYNPNNGFLRKINVFTEYDVVEVVADKYKLLHLNVSSDMISAENIDSTLESLRFINLIQNIEKSSISLHDIDIICRINDIFKENDEQSEEENNG